MIKEKFLELISIQRVMAFLALVLLIFLSATGLSFAQAVTQGYSADSSVKRGMLVRIMESDSTRVEVVNNKTADKTHGVVVDANDAPVTLSAEGQKVFVATAGKYDVLVNDQNGPIRAGDYISVSAIEGIGMRVDDNQSVVIGKTLQEFDGKTGIISSAKIGERSVNIGRVQVDIQVARNPLQKPVSNLPEVMRRTAENIAGKPVNTPRIYLSLLVFLISTSISTSLLLGAIKNGLISIGRNPLSKKSIIRGMLQVVIVGLTIFVSGIFGVYLLLKL